MPDRAPKILFILPSLLSARNLVMSGVTDYLSENADLVVLVMDDIPDEIKERLKSIRGKCLYADDLKNTPTSLFSCLQYKFFKLLHICLGPGFSFGGCVYRFNEMQGFVGHYQKKDMSKERRSKETKAGNFVSPQYGFPFPKSKALYRLSMNAYWNKFLIDPCVRAFFKRECPDTVFIGQIQTAKMHSFILEAARSDITSIGYVASWDQPSTKGPIPDLFDRVVVQSAWMRDQLEENHMIPSKKITAIGWPQMDPYFKKGDDLDRDSIKAKLGIPLLAKVVLFALNAERLGADEPNLVAKLRDWAAKQDKPVHFILRPHPKDKTANERYQFLQKDPLIHYLDKELGSLDALLQQIHVSDVILNSTGSFSLDATALDKPFIYIGFEGEDNVEGKENISNWYNLDHLSSVVNTQAVGPARSFKELTELIVDAFSCPDRKRIERISLKNKHIEPFDGLSAQRLGNLILEERGGA